MPNDELIFWWGFEVHQKRSGRFIEACKTELRVISMIEIPMVKSVD